MKIPFSNHSVHLIATPLPPVAPQQNYNAWQDYIRHNGVCLDIDKAEIWKHEELQLFSKIEVHRMIYVIIGHWFSNSSSRYSCQNLILVKEQVFYASDWQKYVDYHKELM